MSVIPSKFRVAICGGGVGGLTLAFALSRSPNIRVDVYEAASKFTEIGAGIGVWRRTRQVLKSLGLEEDVTRLLSFRPGQDRVPTIQCRKYDQPNGRAMPVGTVYTRGGMMGFHRAEFHEALLNRLPTSCSTSPSKRLESYIQRPGDPIVLRFQDGSTATCDVLLGADGVKSAVRKTMLHEAASLAAFQRRYTDAAELRNLSEPRFSGVFVYRTLIPAERLSRISPQHRATSSAVQYLGKNKYIMAYPISRGRFVNFGAIEFQSREEGTQFGGPWVTEVGPSCVQSLFHGWGKEVSELIQCLGDVKINRWAVNVIPSLPFYAFGNVAILGDAAHAMTPFLGAGAGQAIEDASFLASLLSDELATKTTASHVLGIYSRIRQPFATEVVRRSRLNGEHCSLRSLTGPEYHHFSSSERLQEIMRKIQENFEWISDTDASADLQRAMNLLRADLAPTQNPF